MFSKAAGRCPLIHSVPIGAERRTALKAAMAQHVPSLQRLLYQDGSSSAASASRVMEALAKTGLKPRARHVRSDSSAPIT